VLNPIDLGTIKKQLDAGVYQDVDQVKEDVARVWENCAIFNGADSEIANNARVLAGVFAEKMNAIPDEAVSAALTCRVGMQSARFAVPCMHASPDVLTPPRPLVCRSSASRRRLSR
jgi:hypothetical protein